MKIIIWGDFACPFCYLEETLLEQVAAEVKPDVEVYLEFRAYELDPEAPAVPTETMLQHFMRSHDLSQEAAEEQMARIVKMAARAGLKYNLEGVQVCSTMDAHRLMKMAAEKLDQQGLVKLNFSLFKANFIDNLRLSDHAVLTELGAAAGLDRTEVEQMLESDRYKDLVRRNETDLDSREDMEYIPYMLISGHDAPLQGVISKGAFRKALEPEN